VPDHAPLDDETPEDDNDEPAESVHPLLEIQEIDTETEQLQHRRATLPLRQDLAAARSELRELRQQIDTVGLQRIEVLTRQKRLEDEAAIIQARADKDDNRLYSGEITAIRDLQALQDEIAGLWPTVGTDNLAELADFAGFRGDFNNLFGFDVDGVDYDLPVETEVFLP